VVGEAARTGVHGANRLASNSLLEGAVFGARAGGSAAEAAARRDTAVPDDVPDPGPEPDPQPDVVELLREVMWTGVGVVRTGEMLRAALDELGHLDEKIHPAPSEARSLVEAARLVAAAALARPHSCGAHYRRDGG
jgi:L-aspartate oxidase